ncbi:(d)CMP kinase [Amycolatopsis minnesotensis]|uniref:Cytidylate kinase n=1 Tax=Amycolatopsis minnesotensis TaxID=337894 RepID=A0ABN2R797_9PSEU
MPSDNVKSSVVSVDGPAAAGKTTTSLAVAEIFDMKYLESGRAYRVLAYEALRSGVDPTDPKKMVALCSKISRGDRVSELLGLNRYTAGELRSLAVGRTVSKVAGIAELRRRVTNSVHIWAAGNRRSIVEGRDIGTVVFPTAVPKFYLTASAETRARRRLAQEGSGSLKEVFEDVVRRDRADTTRSASPLVPASDAIIIDTTELSIEQVVDRMAEACGASGLA